MIFTFSGVVTEMQNRLSLLSNWNTTLYYGVYQRIIDTVSYVAEKIIHVAEVYYRESNWSTAQILKSISTKAWIFGYTPSRKVGASGNNVLSADPTFSSSYVYSGSTVVIPKWTTITNQAKSSTVYVDTATSYYTTISGTLALNVKEGTPKQYTYTANGTANEIISLFSDSIDNDTIDIYIVDSLGVVLNTVIIVDNMYFVNDLVNYNCEVNSSNDFQSVEIKFGDGLTSRKLSAGEYVLIKYAETKGSSGDILSTGILTTIQDTLYDNTGSVATLYTTNNEAIANGTDIEDIESIRYNAPHLFQSGYRCGNNADWVAILEDYPTIYKAITWTEEDLGNSTLGYEQNRVYGTAITNTGEALTTLQENDILVNYIKPAKSPTEMFIWEPLEVAFLSAKITAIIANGTTSAVRQEILDTLQANYGILNIDFSPDFYESNVIAIIDNLDKVIRHTTQIFTMENTWQAGVANKQILVSKTSAEESLPENQIYLTNSSLEIWIRRKISNVWSDPLKIGHASGASIINDSSYSIAGGTINYALNSVSYNINEILNNPSTYGVFHPTDTDPLGYEINILYQTEDGDGEQLNSLRTSQFYQISDVDDNFIFTTLTY